MSHDDVMLGLQQSLMLGAPRGADCATNPNSTLEYASVYAAQFARAFVTFESDNKHEIDFHAWCRLFCFAKNNKLTNAFLERFWASPGVGDTLLGEDLLNPAARILRRLFPNGLPDVPDFTEGLSRSQMECGNALGWCETTCASRNAACYRFSYAFAAVLCGSAIAAKPTTSSVNETGACRVYAHRVRMRATRG